MRAELRSRARRAGEELPVEVLVVPRDEAVSGAGAPAAGASRSTVSVDGSAGGSSRCASAERPG